MTYQWKIPGFYETDAQTAGMEFERIYNSRGRLDPADVVEESRQDTAPLHSCFEWDDKIAGEKYREIQAAQLIRAIVVTQDGTESNQKKEIRAFVHVESTYRPMTVVVKNEGRMRELLETALKELEAFERKYSNLAELQPVFKAIRGIDAKGLR